MGCLYKVQGSKHHGRSVWLEGRWRKGGSQSKPCKDLKGRWRNGICEEPRGTCLEYLKRRGGQCGWCG